MRRFSGLRQIPGFVERIGIKADYDLSFSPPLNGSRQIEVSVLPSMTRVITGRTPVVA